jgi:hypothetical protein
MEVPVVIEILLFIGVGIFLICAIVQTVVARREQQLHMKLQAREERAARQDKDRRDNMGGRFYNALARAARENPTGLILVEKFNREDGYWVDVVQKNRDGYRATVMTVCVELSSTGFNVVVDDLSWSRYLGPTEFFVDELIPRLVERTRTFGVK